jgi:hypothetical protein
MSLMTAAQRALAAAFVLSILPWVAPAHAQAEEAKPAPPPQERRSEFLRPEPDCIEWTNLCRTCRQSGDEPAACSNVSIACRPEAVRCTLHVPEQKPPAPPEQKPPAPAQQP